MAARNLLGTVRAGDYVALTRIVYTTIDPTTVLSAVGSVAVFDDQGTSVATFPAIVSAVTALALPAYGGRAGIQLDYQVTIPDTIEPTQEGFTYTAILSVTLSTTSGPVAVSDIQEAFTVLGYEDVNYGPAPEVALAGMSASLGYQFNAMPTTVTLSLYLGNVLKNTWPVPLTSGAAATWTGNNVSFDVDTSNLLPSLMPYAALWTIDGQHDIAPVFVINPSVHLAMKELHNWVNKNCSDWSTKELTFTPEQLIAALYNGACMFNAEHLSTNFTMLNALGQIRAFWLQYSTVWLLQSQVLNGIETDFNYTGQAVTLDVDRASKYQQFADALESSLRDRVRPLKIALTKRGQIDGDGSNNPLTLRQGAIGSIALSMSPVSKMGTMFNPLSWRAALLNPGMPMNLL